MNLDRYKHIILSIATGSFLLIGLLLLLAGTAEISRADPGDHFVTPNGSGDCSQANPCDLQSALALANDDDTIYVGAGIYTGSIGAVVTVTKSIDLLGGWDGTTTTPPVRAPDTYITRLDGEGTRQVVNINGNSSPTLDGFIVTGGIAYDGAGVYVYGGNPIIQNNVITDNRTIDGGSYSDGRGGGIYVGGFGHAIIDQNSILSNTSGYGGGIYHKSTTVITITANQIAGNAASQIGGGILLDRAPDIIQGNSISDNNAGADGGGILLWHASPQVDANYITGNSADFGGGVSLGNNSRPSLYNNMLISNTQDGLFVGSSSPVVVNNTIVGSGLPNSGDGIFFKSDFGCTPPYCATGSITNTIIISYDIGISGSGPITPVIDYNDVWGNITADFSLPVGVVTGTHNISLDPLLINPAADDYHLQSVSPCIDAGDPAGVPPAPPTDLDGHTRPFGNRVDIGAVEYLGFTVHMPLVVR